MSRLPRPRVHQSSRAHSAIERNTATLLLGSGSSKAFLLMRSASISETLVISGNYPSHIRNRYGLEDADFIWLTEICAGKDGSIGSGDIEHRLLSRALKHLKGGGVLMLDDIEYIMVQRGFETLARFIKCLSDAAPHGKGHLIVVANPSAFSRNQMGCLEKYFDKVVRLEPEAESGSRLTSLLLIPAAYLLDGKGEVAYRYVSSRVEAREVVCVTTVPPMRLKERHGFPQTEFIWLTEVGQERDQFRPEKLCSDVQRALMRRLNSGRRPVVLLDSLDQLLVHVDFADVLRFVKNTIDAAAVMDGTVIATADFDALDNAQCAVLARRFDLLFRCE